MKVDIEWKWVVWFSFKFIVVFFFVINGNRRLIDEEVGLFFELESKFEGVKFINKVIFEYLKSKILK